VWVQEQFENFVTVATVKNEVSLSFVRPTNKNFSTLSVDYALFVYFLIPMSAALNSAFQWFECHNFFLTNFCFKYLRLKIRSGFA
jgi:hypothetical protein